jgi:hypothetical protein
MITLSVITLSGFHCSSFHAHALNLLPLLFVLFSLFSNKSNCSLVSNFVTQLNSMFNVTNGEGFLKSVVF